MIATRGFRSHVSAAVLRWLIVLVAVLLIAPLVMIASSYARTVVGDGPVVECQEQNPDAHPVSDGCRAINMSDAAERESQR